MEPRFPALTESGRVALLDPPTGRVGMVLDTDAANEIDDQFALAYALLVTDRLSVEAVYAAPFAHPGDDVGPAEGMERSRAEIGEVFRHAGLDPAGMVYEGARRWLTGSATAVDSPATADLVERARAATAPLFVVAIGAPTNVAAALLAAPDIVGRVVVVWLGGNPSYWHPAAEFNVAQDPVASRVLLDSGVALVHVPCHNVTGHLRTTEAEVDRHVRPAGGLGRYLADLLAGRTRGRPGRSKELWDLGAIAWLVEPAWAPSTLLPSPLLTTEGTWSRDPRRHLVRELTWIDRDALFADLFRRLGHHAATVAVAPARPVLRGAAPVRIRDAVPADDEALRSVDARTWDPGNTPAPRSQRTRFLPEDPDGPDVLVAEVDARVAGFLVYGPPTPLPSSAHVWHIHGLGVDPDHQGRGVAGALLQELERRATVGGARKLSLRVLATNPGAQQLYRRHGYRVEAVLRGEFVIAGREVDDVLMARPLG